MVIRTRDDILATLRAALERRTEILEAYLFGSVARGNARAHSDVDVAVYLDPSWSAPSAFGADAEIATDLVRALGRDDVDVVVLNHAPPLLYHRVLSEGVRVLSRDLEATTTREARAHSRYFDWLPTQAKIERLAAERLRSGGFGR